MWHKRSILRSQCNQPFRGRMVKPMSITQTMCIYLMSMTVNTRDYIKPSECVQLQHKQEQKKMLLQGIVFFFLNRFCKKVKYCFLKRSRNQTRRFDRHKTDWTTTNYHLTKTYKRRSDLHVTGRDRKDDQQEEWW